jgi:zinc transporter 7
MEALDTTRSVWLEAYGAVTLISTLPTAILFFLPNFGNGRTATESHGATKLMLSFAVGGMLGDVFLHLIPHLLVPHDHHSSSHEGDHHHESHDHHDHHHESHGHDGHHDDLAMRVGALILAGFFLFYLSEIAIHSCIEYLRPNKSAHLHHSHAKYASSSAAKKKNDDIEVENDVSRGSSLLAGGILNLVADALHNVTDGIAIGASFLMGQSIGVATTISIVLHELPHELGDYAVLINSGFSKWQAIGAQFLTAIGAFIGVTLGLSMIQ